MIRVAIGLGGNLGDREALLRGAIPALAALGRDVRVASLYETPPFGPPQPDYLNSAVSLVTELSPTEVLEAALAIERAAGRVRDVRWGPRTLDLDLLAAIDGLGEIRLSVPTLTLPHPELGRRPFALAPLCEVLPELSSTYAPLLAEAGGAPNVVGWARRDGKGWTGKAHRK